MNFLQSLALWVIPFLLVLGVVVTVHELGHFLAARALGTRVDRFAIGFGRAIASWRDKAGVEWRLGWMPFGGYVRFAGDDNMASIPDADDLAVLRRELEAREGAAALNEYFHFKPIWQRMIIVLAGPVANFILAIAIFAIFFMTMGQQVQAFRVESVVPNSPAAVAGFSPGDLVIGVDGREMRDQALIRQTINLRGGLPTTFTVERDGRTVLLNATPRWEVQHDPVGGDQKVGVIGVMRSADEPVQRIRYGFFQAIGAGAGQTWDVLTTSLKYIGRMITGQVDADQLRGPLGIADVTKKVTQLSADGAPDLATMLKGVGLSLVNLAALISVSIGFMNLLPVPVLDGGHLMFYAYEAIARRPLAAKVQAAGYRVGLALVLGLMLFATWNDLQRLRVFNLFERLFS